LALCPRGPPCDVMTPGFCAGGAGALPWRLALAHAKMGRRRSQSHPRGITVARHLRGTPPGVCRGLCRGLWSAWPHREDSGMIWRAEGTKRRRLTWFLGARHPTRFHRGRFGTARAPAGPILRERSAPADGLCSRSITSPKTVTGADRRTRPPAAGLRRLGARRARGDPWPDADAGPTEAVMWREAARISNQRQGRGVRKARSPKPARSRACWMHGGGLLDRSIACTLIRRSTSGRAR